MEEDVVFLVLDVETTGLDAKTSHIIQLAAKVLGSSNGVDLFSGKDYSGLILYFTFYLDTYTTKL